MKTIICIFTFPQTKNTEDTFQERNKKAVLSMSGSNSGIGFHESDDKKEIEP